MQKLFYACKSYFMRIKLLYKCKSYFMHGKATLCALSYFMHEIVTLCMQKLLYPCNTMFAHISCQEATQYEFGRNMNLDSIWI